MNSGAADIRLIGGRLCLDFLNTLNHGLRGDKEYLHCYDDLLIWLRHTDTLTAHEAVLLHTAAALATTDAAQVFAAARRLRTALASLVDTASAGSRLADTDLVVLNELLGQAPPRSQLVAEPLRLRWASTDNRLDSVLWPIVWSAADLLTSSVLQQVRVCAGDGCSWRFLDTTPNRSRMWCSMEDCGNRAKARRHYARRRGSGPVH